MSIKSGFQKFYKTFFNFRPGLWMDLDGIKSNTRYYYRQFRSLYNINRVSEAETFADAEQRLNLNTEYLELQSKHYLFLVYFYLVLSLSIFCYCFWLFLTGNWMGCLMALAITLYALSFAFRYHFWRYQIQKRKLSCSFAEWLNDFLKIKISN